MKEITQNNNSASIYNRLINKRSSKLSLIIILTFFVVAFFADFLANEKPIFCVHEGKSYFPIFNSYAHNLGLSKIKHPDYTKDWKDIKFDKALWPILHYSGSTIDLKNKFKSPFEEKTVVNGFGRHPLGSGQLGKDVATGIIHGTRIALLVGILSMLIAALIGIFIGAIAGYFGDDKIKINWLHILLFLPFVCLGFYWAYIISLGIDNIFGKFVLAITIVSLIAFIPLAFAERLSEKLKIEKNISLPLDLFLMRVIEIVNAIPALLLLFALLAIIKSSSVWTLIVIIGLVRWTSIARFVRAEMLKLREMEFIQSAQVLGLSSTKTLIKHALPNALTAVVITIAFGIASAILIEASLSFLSLGVSDDTMTWGKMLSYARQKTSAWWLAIFPGIAIFLCVYAFNNIGEALNKKVSH